MPNLRITKEFSFEMAHALKHYSGKCENIHGHTYHLSVTVSGPVVMAENSPNDGMVMDFTDLKKIIQEKILDIFDHALVINEHDSRKASLQAIHTKLILTPFQPTSENLILDIVKRIQNNLGQTFTLQKVKLRETSSSFAEWYADDNR
jgi:6-pyruvoyltetrahydropterin/6-carboxytetrahydropterin synthase